MNRDHAMSLEQAKALAEELARLIASLESELSILVNKEYEKLVDKLLPPGGSA
jgi:hypothetical protein